MKIRDMTAADADPVLAIYAEGIATGHATFESEPPDWAGFDAKRLKQPRLVAELDGHVVGWAAASGVSDRCVYGGVAEGTIYIAEAARGQGIGKALLTAFVRAAEAAGIWTLNAGIFTDNLASIRLHEACGYRMVGTRERLGRMGFGPRAGEWRDVALMEYRSQRVGVD
ncbi:N-acetyltransferase family protein [Hyphobacterium sp. HN65]|uniref:N-acetyltransferase family protein n=1 Tax=Hyphobacterium lacteum TaxID=3116575 RepID=A0ABU7LND3_9PROT|nr:N-acetyltransferase family protein [Hyphobacterium sp. HN65]MEE2525121.1 N-acetyltransferase family protein [Hyphobacterium sp. HN65]